MLNKTHEAVTIRENEAAIVERAFLEGLISPFVSKVRHDKKIAIIGSGPAGLACANRLNHAGYDVTVFEKDEAAGGLLRFGIPDFKLNKSVIDRRIDLMEKEGVKFVYNTTVGKDISTGEILEKYDAVCVAIGSGVPRDLNVEGRELKGIHFALELLKQQNRVVAGKEFDNESRITAKGKNVLVIGGGDTGSDCVGTANRQGALSVTQIEIMPKPPVDENPATPWPYWPVVLKTSSSHEEGCERRWLLDTKKFIGNGDNVAAVEVEEVEWQKDEKTGKMNLLHTGRISTIKAELVLLAMGFTNPVYDGLIKELNVELDCRKNVKVDGNQSTSVDKVFAAGDASTGASLVVRCIASGQKTAQEIDKYLKNK